MGHELPGPGGSKVITHSLGMASLKHCAHQGVGDSVDGLRV